MEVKNRKIWGVALVVKKTSSYPSLKELLDIKTGKWSDDSKSLIRLYEWIASYYQCDLGRVFRPIVSKNVLNKKSKKITVYKVISVENSSLKESYKKVLSILSEMGDFTRASAEARGIKSSEIDYLFKKGYLSKSEQEIIREAGEMEMSVDHHTEHLTNEQLCAVEKMNEVLVSPDKPFLLHGITGSGKTHIYIDLTSRTLELGKAVIILVPEISLTPQTIARFRASLGNIMTVIHSNMSDGERRDSLQELVTGAKKVVIGVRSAILAPMDNVGLIIVDEEHDGSYKQSDLEPRYNARDVAVMRGHFQHALVVLGSATPSFESFYNSQIGKYHYLKLNNRYGQGALPTVHIVSMTEEHNANNWTILSRHLTRRIEEVLADKRQIILLLNKRGFSTVLICKECGHTCMCPNCSVYLRYHRTDNSVKCHFCGYQIAAPQVCPKCKGEQIKYKGTGIQRAEEFIKELFPVAKVLRMDQDTTKRKGAHISILQDFANGNADILIGTQMVSKGLNFPGVALVGVISADTGLHLPDFRASERTFQLLTQVAGRAGRADSEGEVIVQTYFPEEKAVTSARTHDFETFYNSEILSRKELNYPPFSKLSRVIMEGADEGLVKSKIYDASLVVKRLNLSGIQILGPSPAAVSKINNEVRFSLLFKSVSPRIQSAALMEIRKHFEKLPKSVRLIIDVDPCNML